MSIGSKDYWMTQSRWLADLIVAIDSSLSSINTKLTKFDVLDGKLDGIINLDKLTAEDTGLLATILGLEVGAFDDADLLEKLDNLDGKKDGVLDLTKIGGSLVDSGGEAMVNKFAAVVSNLVEALVQHTGIHADTTAMIDFATESWNGQTTYGYWVLVSSISHKRNMLKVNNDSGNPMDYSRDGGFTMAGTISKNSSATFYDAPGVWLIGPTAAGWSAYEEWAT